LAFVFLARELLRPVKGSTDGNKMLYLIEPDPSGFKPLASAELLDQGENWAPIALAEASC
jgi:hypothetical protein